jgi:hypothetical protein
MEQGPEGLKKLNVLAGMRHKTAAVNRCDGSIDYRLGAAGFRREQELRP